MRKLIYFVCLILVCVGLNSCTTVYPDRYEYVSSSGTVYYPVYYSSHRYHIYHRPAPKPYHKHKPKHHYNKPINKHKNQPKPSRGNSRNIKPSSNKGNRR